VRIELQWHQIKGCPGVSKLVKNTGSEEPAHIADTVIDAMKARQSVTAPSTCQMKKRGRRTPRSATA
jgi:hypothetical protein